MSKHCKGAGDPAWHGPAPEKEVEEVQELEEFVEARLARGKRPGPAAAQPMQWCTRGPHTFRLTEGASAGSLCVRRGPPTFLWGVQVPALAREGARE
eukprot:904-Alexandrium_andersonii.AAC.1